MTKNIWNKLKIYLLIVSIVLPIFFSITVGYFVADNRSDFCQDYKSAKLILNKKSPYNQIKCWDFQPPFDTEINPHPPFSILFYIPLLLFEKPAASFIWSIFLTVFYFSAIFFLAKSLNKDTPFILAISFLLNFYWLPFYFSIVYVNIIQLILLLLTLAWYFNLKNQEKYSGFLIGIAALIRLWPAIFLLPFLIAKKNKALKSFFLTVIIGTFLTLIPLELQTYIYYFTYVQSVENIYILHIGNISFISFIAKIIYILGANINQSIIAAKIVGGVCFLIITAFFWLKLKSRILNKRNFSLSLGLFLSLSYFIFPTIWEWSLTIYLLIFFIILKELLLRSYTNLKMWLNLIPFFIFFFLLRFIANNQLPENLTTIQVDLKILMLSNFSLLIGTIYLIILQSYLIFTQKNKIK